MRRQDLCLLVVCAVAILWSFRWQQSGFFFASPWVIPLDPSLYSNYHFPSASEMGPLPVILVDGSIVIGKRDCTITKFRSELSTNPLVVAQANTMRTSGIMTGRRPVAIAAGYLTPYYQGMDDNQRKQVIVVVTDGWVVLCFSDDLTLMWESSVMDELPSGSWFHDEVAVLIAPHAMRVGDEGVVVVAGKMSPAPINDAQVAEHEHAIFKEDDPEELGDKPEDFDHHFSYYAFNGQTGAMRWKHEAGDFYAPAHGFDPHPDEDDEDAITKPKSAEHSFKLHVFDQAKHAGEVDWTNYKSYMLSHLPHRWVDRYDTRLTLDRFEKQFNQGRRTTQYGDKTSSTQKNNVIVAHTKKGIEVIHLYTGRPITQLLLPHIETASSRGSYADINQDNVVDQVHALIMTETTNQNAKDIQKQTCQAIAYTGIQIQDDLWNGSLVASSGGSLMFSIHAALRIPSRNIQVVAPAYASRAPRKGYDTINHINTGRITSFSPSGKVNWAVETMATWPYKQPSLSQAANPDPVPSLVELRAEALGQNHLLAIGESIVLLTVADGEIVTTKALNKREDGTPNFANAPVVVGDFNNDGLPDIIITTPDGHHGYALQNGVYPLLFPILIGFLICVMLYIMMQRGMLQLPTKDARSSASKTSRSTHIKKWAID